MSNTNLLCGLAVNNVRVRGAAAVPRTQVIIYPSHTGRLQRPLSKPKRWARVPAEVWARAGIFI